MNLCLHLKQAPSEYLLPSQSALALAQIDLINCHCSKRAGDSQSRELLWRLGVCAVAAQLLLLLSGLDFQSTEEVNINKKVCVGGGEG